MNNFENFDEIEIKIKNLLDALVIEADEKKYEGNTIWTNRIKELLRDLGWELGFEVCPDGSSNPAWLFDLNWYLTNEDDRIISLPLVVESEWNRDLRSIRYDFEKLLTSNAEHRLMICQAKTELIEERFQYFEKAVQDYCLNNKNDRYLIAILDD